MDVGYRSKIWRVAVIFDSQIIYTTGLLTACKLRTIPLLRIPSLTPPPTTHPPTHPTPPPPHTHIHNHTHTCTYTQLMVTIGNDNANSFWEHHYHGERLPADMEREIRENFIRAKYQVKSWIPTHTGEGRENLSQLLCISVKTNNLMRTLELLVHGADVSCVWAVWRPFGVYYSDLIVTR